MTKIKFCLLCIIILMLSACSENVEPPAPKTSINTKRTSDWDTIVQTNELKIGVPDAELSFDNDLIDAFSKEVPFEVKKVTVNWDMKEDVLNSGKVDFLWGQIPDSSDNSEKYSLSIPYISNKLLLISKKETTFSDKLKVSVVNKSFELDIAKNIYSNLETEENNSALFKSLEIGKTEAVFINSINEYYLNNQDEYKILTENEYNYVLAFKQNETEVKNEIEKVMAKIKANGIVSEISEKWFKEDLMFK